MTKNINILIILFFPLVFFSQETRTTLELNKVFTESEIKDINTLVNYFESKIKIGDKELEQCYKDWFWTIQNSGFESVYDISIFDFNGQIEVYKIINKSTFNEIWTFTKQYNLGSKDTLKVVVPNFDGKYLQYIKEIGKRRIEVKDYYESIDWSFEYGMISALPVFLKRSTVDNDWEFRNGFKDYNDKIILTITTLTVVDNVYRKEKWGE